MNTREWRDWSCAVAVVAVDETDLEPAVRIVRAVMAEVQVAVSRFDPASELARINAHAGRYVTVSPLTISLLQLGLDVAARTGDTVTPTVGAALAALGYDDDIAAIRDRPTDTPTTYAPVPLAADAIHIDHDLGRVGLSRGTSLDLGATAKAYAVDEAVRRIGHQAADGVLVSIGGDLAVHGTPAEGWTIAVGETAGDVAELAVIDTGGLATSSVVGRRWGHGRHHIVDPSTGACADGPWRTATVWAPTTVEANLLSTWLLIDADAALAALAAERWPARLVNAAGGVERFHGWPASEEVAAS